ncbi:GNAT family N-acetyltransferase [Chloroflexota bacterium]
MLNPVNPYCQRLDDNLIMKSVSTPDEAARLAAFNAIIHGGEVEHLTRKLLLHHPRTCPDDWLFIEDESTGQIVSSLCLIPWQWRYGTVTLKAGEMGIVGTLEEYRRRGLIRALVERFMTMLQEGDYALSQIQGIPYYYRQFGYEYAVPLIGGLRVGLHTIPAEPASEPHYIFRPATLDDVPDLQRLYDESAADSDISAVRDAAIWRYILAQSPGTDTEAETWIISASGSFEAAGYYRIERYGFGAGLNICEASRLNHAMAVAVLQHAKTRAADRQKPFIKLMLSAGHALNTVARAWAAYDEGTYAWQIHLPDVALLLRQIAPVLEQRVADSPFAGLTQTVCLNLFKEAFEMCFIEGRLTAVNAVGFREGGEFRLPPLQFAPLVLGYRTLAEMQHMYPDIGINGQNRLLFEVLFPPMQSYIHLMY